MLGLVGGRAERRRAEPVRRGDRVPLRPGGASIPARDGGRTLLLNSAQHSYVDLADPTHLEYEYTQWIGAVADVVAPKGQRLDALHLGGGGFTMPRYLTATRPGTDNVVFEIDGELVELGRAGAGRTHRAGAAGRGG